MAERDDVRWGLAQRFELIEWRAYWTGRVNRSDLEERFGLSTPQASVDLRAYQEAAPNNLEYNATEKAYLPTDRFAPKFLKLSADRYLLQLDAIMNGAITTADTWFGSLPPVAVMQTVTRPVEPVVLRAVLRAIEGRRELQIVYQSLTNTRARAIVPHSLGFDGHRWHARAWCVDREDFRDFVLSRIESIGESTPSNIDPSSDIEWNTFVDLRIIAHPDLVKEKRSAIERDFGMVDGLLTIKTRVALAYYLIKRLNLDLTAKEIAAERKQVFLTNLPEVKAAVDAAKSESSNHLVQKQNS